MSAPAIAAGALASALAALPLAAAREPRAAAIELRCVERIADRYIAKQGASAWLEAPYSSRRIEVEANTKVRGCRVSSALFRVVAPQLGGARVAYVQSAEVSPRPTTTVQDYKRAAAAKASGCPAITLPPAQEMLRNPEMYAGRCVALRVPVRAMERFVVLPGGAGLRMPTNLDGVGRVLLDAALPQLLEDAARGWRDDETFELFGSIGVPQPYAGDGAKTPPLLPVVEVLAVYDGYRSAAKEPVEAPRARPVANVDEIDPRVGIAFEDIAEGDAPSLGVASTRGAVIQEVDPHSRAAIAGLRPGDIVVECGGQPVESAADLGRVVDAVGRAPEFRLKVLRNGQPVTLTVRRRPAPTSTPHLSDEMLRSPSTSPLPPPQ